MVRYVLRLEGLCFFLLSFYMYNNLHGNWILFVALLLVPDISMIGYLKDNKLGSILYNLMHNYILALLIIAGGLFVFNNALISQLGVILFAHVSFDRLFGYGLKYPSN